MSRDLVRLDQALHVARRLELLGGDGLKAAFVAQGGTLVDTGPATGWRARLHGVQSTCTYSGEVAVQGWRRLVIRKAAAAGLIPADPTNKET